MKKEIISLPNRRLGSLLFGKATWLKISSTSVQSVSRYKAKNNSADCCNVAKNHERHDTLALQSKQRTFTIFVYSDIRQAYAELLLCPQYLVSRNIARNVWAYVMLFNFAQPALCLRKATSRVPFLG